MSKNNLNFKQRLHNAAGSVEVENVKARHSLLHTRADATTEFGGIWAHNDDTSWAHLFGRMRGFDQVWYGVVNHYDEMAMQNWLKMHNIYPEVAGKDPRPLMEASVHTLATDIIEVAEDGMSARAAFMTPGVIHSVLTPDEKKYCGILWERYGADFVYENDRWLYIHEHVCPDIGSELDSIDWAADDYKKRVDPVAENPGPPEGWGPQYLADLGPLHNMHSVVQPPQNTCPWPEPYNTLDNDNTYTVPLKYTYTPTSVRS